MITGCSITVMSILWNKAYPHRVIFRIHEFHKKKKSPGLNFQTPCINIQMDQTSRRRKAEIFCIALQPEGKKLLHKMGKPTKEGIPVVEKKVLLLLTVWHTGEDCWHSWAFRASSRTAIHCHFGWLNTSDQTSIKSSPAEFCPLQANRIQHGFMPLTYNYF